MLRGQQRHLQVCLSMLRRTPQASSIGGRQDLLQFSNRSQFHQEDILNRIHRNNNRELRLRDSHSGTSNTPHSTKGRRHSLLPSLKINGHHSHLSRLLFLLRTDNITHHTMPARAHAHQLCHHRLVRPSHRQAYLAHQPPRPFLAT
jgi:hypothetical protein